MSYIEGHARYAAMLFVERDRHPVDDLASFVLAVQCYLLLTVCIVCPLVRSPCSPCVALTSLFLVALALSASR